jgi:ABC-2 type transport system permease protein
MRSFVQLYIASLREFRRDLSALFWSFAFPIMFILIFGIIFSGGGDISFDIGIVNEDGAASQQLVDGFKSIDAFDITVGKQADELSALKDGDRSVVIIIPEGTGRRLGEYFQELNGTTRTMAQDDSLPQVPLQVYYDPSDQNAAQVALNIVDKVIAGMNENMTGITPALTIEPETVSADNLRTIDYLVPGVLAMTLMQMGLFATAGPLVSLREKQVLRRMGATPLSRFTLLSSQVAFRLTMAVIQTALIVVLGMVVFDVQIEMSNLPGMIGMVLLGGTMFITMGYFLSGLAKTEEAIQGLISLPNFIFMFLSGIFFPLDFMPSWIRPVVDVIPLTYVADALRKMMLDAGSFYSLTRSVIIVSIWLVVCAVLAVKFFKWEPQG